MATKPSGQPIGTTGHFAIKANAGHAAEIVIGFLSRFLSVRRCIGRLCRRRDHAQIDALDVAISRAEAGPDSQCIPHTPKPKSVGKVIAAADRHNEQWQAEFDERAEITLNGAVTTEEQDNVSFIAAYGQSDVPLDVPRLLKWLEALGRTS